MKSVKHSTSAKHKKHLSHRERLALECANYLYLINGISNSISTFTDELFVGLNNALKDARHYAKVDVYTTAKPSTAKKSLTMHQRLSLEYGNYLYFHNALPKNFDSLTIQLFNGLSTILNDLKRFCDKVTKPQDKIEHTFRR